MVSVTLFRRKRTCRKQQCFTFSESQRGCERPVRYIAARPRSCACVGDSRGFLQGRQHPPQTRHGREQNRRHRTVAQRWRARVIGYAARRCFINKNKSMRTLRNRWRQIYGEKKTQGGGDCKFWQTADEKTAHNFSKNKNENKTRIKNRGEIKFTKAKHAHHARFKLKTTYTQLTYHPTNWQHGSTACAALQTPYK
jgi:hypothetical protein